MSDIDALRAAVTFLRKRLIGTPPDVDMEDFYFAGLLDEAEAAGRAALASPKGDGLDWQPLVNEAFDAIYELPTTEIDADTGKVHPVDPTEVKDAALGAVMALRSHLSVAEGQP